MHCRQTGRDEIQRRAPAAPPSPVAGGAKPAHPTPATKPVTRQPRHSQAVVRTPRPHRREQPPPRSGVTDRDRDLARRAHAAPKAVTPTTPSRRPHRARSAPAAARTTLQGQHPARPAATAVRSTPPAASRRQAARHQGWQNRLQAQPALHSPAHRRAIDRRAATGRKEEAGRQTWQKALQTWKQWLSGIGKAGLLMAQAHALSGRCCMRPSAVREPGTACHAGAARR